MKKVVFLFNEKDPVMSDEYSMATYWWYGILENMGYDVVYYDYADGNFNFDNFYKEIKEFRPDFIIHACYSKFHTEFIKLRDLAKVFVMQSDDDYRFHNYAKFWIPIVDGTISFCGDRNLMKLMYSSNFASENSFLHGYWAFNPNTMMLNETYPDRSILLSHMGAIYGERGGIISEFKRCGIHVENFSGIKYDEFKKITSMSRFTLCLTKSADLSIRQLKGRIFELPNFSILLSEPFPNMEQYYDIDKEIVVFNSVNEGIDKIKNLLTDVKLCDTLFNNGRKRLLSEHTCYHVWDKFILPKMDVDYKKSNVSGILKEKHGILI